MICLGEKISLIPTYLEVKKTKSGKLYIYSPPFGLPGQVPGELQWDAFSEDDETIGKYEVQEVY